MTTLRSIDRSIDRLIETKKQTTTTSYITEHEQKSITSFFYERKTIYHTKFHLYSITIDDADPLVLMFVKKNKCMYE